MKSNAPRETHMIYSEFFQCVIWRLEDGYRTFISANERADKPLVFKNTLECSPEQLLDLEGLTRMVQLVIEHLDSGGTFGVGGAMPGPLFDPHDN